MSRRPQGQRVLIRGIMLALLAGTLYVLKARFETGNAPGSVTPGRPAAAVP